jgi:hypothetical protein
MFDLLRYVCELIFGSSLSLSRESFDYLSSNLHGIIIQLIQQSFFIALRSKRTRLLGDDLQLILQCRAISPLFGYCCSSTTNTIPSLQTPHQDPCNSYRNKNYHANKYIVSYDDIILHVEWLAIAGEQKLPQIKSSSLLNIEQQLYLSFLQSKKFNEEIYNFLRYDQIALNSILSYLVEWCRTNICECLVHSCRLRQRRELAYYLTIIDCLLENSSTTIDLYLHILSPIIMTCLLYEFEVRNHTILDLDSLILYSRLMNHWILMILTENFLLVLIIYGQFVY